MIYVLSSGHVADSRGRPIVAALADAPLMRHRYQTGMARLDAVGPAVAALVLLVCGGRGKE